MSNFVGKAINPKTGEEEWVSFLDNYFGQRKYGVRFEDGEVYPIYQVKRLTNKEE